LDLIRRSSLLCPSIKWRRWRFNNVRPWLWRCNWCWSLVGNVLLANFKAVALLVSML